MSDGKTPLEVPRTDQMTARPGLVTCHRLSVGDRVRFAPYKRAMTVRGVTTGGRFVILTMPFPPKHTVIYTVIDFERGVRGADDHYGLGYETDEQVARALEWFQATEDDLPGKRAREAEARGEKSWPSVAAANVSWRNFVELDIVSVVTAVTPPEPCQNDHGPDGINPCWNPGGPCPAGQTVCESCGPCNACTLTKAANDA